MMMIPKPEFPRPDKERASWLNLNGQWDFALFAEGREKDEAAFAKKRAAYDRQITVPFSWVCPLSGVEENVAGIGWYRRTVEFAAKGRVFLCFGAVDYLCDVYVNGKLAGQHQGGYTQFDLDVTKLWKQSENTIEVRAEDYRRENQTYGKQGYGETQGIWQTVWLEERPDSYIDWFRITTKCSGAIEIQVEANAKNGEIVTAEFDGGSYSAEVKDGAATIAFTLKNPKLWSPDAPNLYEGALTLNEDRVSTYFGVREIGTCAGNDGKWITLNGKPIYLNGTLDQAFNPKGHFTYPSDQDMHDEAWRLKRLGLNMIRIHIKPEEPRKLYWMDKLGVLVMEDIPCFWGNPDEVARAAYESEWPDTLRRDINHPSTFAWVMFNETWGLFTKENDVREYRKDTQDWVRDVHLRAKALDPSRIVEDNSPCNYDHIETDINTWHFYINGYENVRDHVQNVVKNTYPGSGFNYTEGNTQTDAPLMNSECGMVWGVDESAGDSDLAWQYHYMLNEFRLHDKLCGFVFTEFHDVVNEFNGYYRIDDTDKDFGYQDFCEGMTIRDLHAADFIATDCAPCRTMGAGEVAVVPLTLSSFTDANHGKRLTLEWSLWHDGLNGRVVDDYGMMELPTFGYGATDLGEIDVIMPDENAVAVLSLYLKNGGEVISRNFITFDVRAELPKDCVTVPVTAGKAKKFAPQWTAMNGEKVCFGGAGEVSYTIALPFAKDSVNGLQLIFEAGAKRVLSKDIGEIGDDQRDLGFMRGYLVDRGAFKNSYFMTDEEQFPSNVVVAVNGETVASFRLDNDWADARGVLSWHSQQNARRLDEAGSYGELKVIELPSRLIPAILTAGKLTVTFKADKGGLALYGRFSGRYPVGLMVKAW